MKAKLISYLSIPTFTELNWRWTREDGWLLLHEVSFLQGSCAHGTYFGLLLFLHSNLLLDLEACVANQAAGNEVAIWLLPGTLLTKIMLPPPAYCRSHTSLHFLWPSLVPLVPVVIAVVSPHCHYCPGWGLLQGCSRALEGVAASVPHTPLWAQHDSNQCSWENVEAEEGSIYWLGSDRTTLF